jgi:nucleotide-binding universal stress UspA family protein
MTIKRILHASDFSPAGRPAFTLARELAQAFKAELILFHAYQALTPLVAEAPLPPTMLDEMMASARADARQRLERLAKSAKAGRLRVSTLLAEGSAADSIVRAAKRNRVGLIVLGTHGRGGVARMVLGSVAERVVRTAHCPVLTVRAGRA